MMRVLVVAWSARQIGGTETYLARIMALLARAGCAIAFYAEHDGPDDRPSIPLPPQAVSLPSAGTRAEGLAAIAAWSPDVLFVHGLFDPAFEERLQGIAPAVLFAHAYNGTCISGEKTHKYPTARPCGRRFGAACLALYYPRRCGGLSPLTMVRDYARQRRRLDVLRQYAAVVTASEHMRQELAGHGAAGGRVVCCPLPAPASASPADRLPFRAGRRRAGCHLLFAGRMDRLKGGDRLIDVLPGVQAALGQPLEVTMAGDGPARSRWERAADVVTRAHPAIRIRFTGWLERAALDALLASTDALVMPGIWPEPFGLVGVEANGRGVPVVAYAAGGIPEWLTEGRNGCLAPADPPTADGLKDAIVRCVRLLSSTGDLHHGAREAAAAHSEEAHVAAVLAVLSQAASGAVVAGLRPA